MTHDEFEQWRQQHGVTFPAFATGAAALPVETLRAWADSMAGISLTSAKMATKQIMHAGKVLFKPEDHIAAVHARCEFIPPRERPVEGRFRCSVCVDDGAVSIYAEDFVSAVLADRDLEKLWMYAETTAVCQCRADKNETIRNREMLVYNERNHCRVGQRPWRLEAAVEDVHDWDRNRVKRTDDCSKTFMDYVPDGTGTYKREK